MPPPPPGARSLSRGNTTLRGALGGEAPQGAPPSPGSPPLPPLSVASRFIPALRLSYFPLICGTKLQPQKADGYMLAFLEGGD